LSDRPFQEEFSLNLARLIIFIYESGYKCTGGEWWRTPEMAEIYARNGKGIKDSLHLRRLAIDLNLFKDGKYLNTTEAHRPFGEYWKSLHFMNRWGGDFHNSKGEPKPDGNHYEMNPSDNADFNVGVNITR